MKKVGIILVLFNQEKLAENFLVSLSEQVYNNYILYIVDNNSNEGIMDRLKVIIEEKNINADFIKLTINSGYGIANNIGTQKAIKDKCEYIIISNADIEMESISIKVLVEEIEKHGGAGVIGPVVMEGSKIDDKNIIQSFGASVNYNFQYHKLNYKGRVFNEAIVNNNIETDYVSGAFFLIKKEVVEECGLFPDDFFMYNEEIDLARRLKEKGIKVALTSATKVWHNHDENKSIESKCMKYYYMMRNRILYYKKYKLYPQMILYSLYQILTSPFKLKWALKYANAKLFYFYYLGLYMGIRGERFQTKLTFRSGINNG